MIRLCRCCALAPGHGPRHTSTIDRCHLRGEELRSRLRLPGRSLLPSATLKRVAALRPSRTLDRFARRHFRSGARDPPDLDADFPDAFRSLRPGRKAGFLSWGCPKIAPPSYTIEESDSRLCRISCSLRVAALRLGPASPACRECPVRHLSAASHRCASASFRPSFALVAPRRAASSRCPASVRRVAFPRRFDRSLGLESAVRSVLSHGFRVSACASPPGFRSALCFRSSLRSALPRRFGCEHCSVASPVSNFIFSHRALRHGAGRCRPIQPSR
jgi:hypothetical protein